MPKYLLAVFTVILASLACSWTDVAPPPAPVIEPSPLPTFAISTLTPIPTETPLPTPTSTPDVPVAWPKELGINCRYGPGEEWETVSSITPETIIEIKGRTVNTQWWYVVDPLHDGKFCWAAYDVVDTAGNLNIVPILEVPTASVTNVTVVATVTFNACGSDNPVAFSGEITTNGPVSVTYHWEVSGDAQSSTPDTTFQANKSGPQKVSVDFFSDDCGNYSVRLVVTSPNDSFAEKRFTIQAP